MIALDLLRMYRNNMIGRYPNEIDIYRGPRFVQAGSGPNFRKFFTSVYSGIRPLLSSAWSAVKGSAKEAGLKAVDNFFNGNDLEDIIRSGGKMFVNNLRDRAVNKIDRLGSGGQYGSGFPLRPMLYKHNKSFVVNPFALNSARVLAVRKQRGKIKKKEFGKIKSIKRRKKSSRRKLRKNPIAFKSNVSTVLRKKRKRGKQIGSGKKRVKRVKKKNKSVKSTKRQRKRSKVIRQLDIFS